MKLNNCILAFSLLTAAAFTGCKNEDPAEHHFDNKLYISSATFTDDLLIDPSVPTTSRTVTMRLAMPAEKNVTVKLEARPDLAAQYNLIYNDNAFALPEEYYEIPEQTATIAAGTVFANDIPVNFTGINTLDVKSRYVLPVQISEVDGMSLLASRRTVYFIVRGAALINVVADITKLKASINWSAAARAVVSSMSQVTVEALVYTSDWKGGRDGYGLSTIFGIEGSFLIRVGDADRNPNQLQLVSPGNPNWPAKAASPALPVDEWVHIAVVYDGTNRELHYYLNGEEVASAANMSSSTVNVSSGCWIGYAYDNSRWFPGRMSEMRIWNVARTAQQIADNPYRVDPATPGLVAYWKFNEGAGRTIKDQTSYGTDITFERCGTETASDDPTWIDVQIPSLN